MKGLKTVVRTIKVIKAVTFNKVTKATTTEVVIANNEAEATANLSKRFGRKGSAVILEIVGESMVKFELDDNTFLKYAKVVEIDGEPVSSENSEN